MKNILNPPVSAHHLIRKILSSTQEDSELMEDWYFKIYNLQRDAIDVAEPGDISMIKNISKETFIDGLRDSTLRREVRHVYKSSEHSTLRDVMNLCLKMKIALEHEQQLDASQESDHNSIVIDKIKQIEDLRGNKKKSRKRRRKRKHKVISNIQEEQFPSPVGSSLMEANSTKVTKDNPYVVDSQPINRPLKQLYSINAPTSKFSNTKPYNNGHGCLLLVSSLRPYKELHSMHRSHWMTDGNGNGYEARLIENF